MSGQALEPPTWPAGPRTGPLTVHRDSSMPSGPSRRSRGLCPSRPGCLLTAHPPSQQGGLNQSTCRGREGPFKARTMEHSSWHQEKPGTPRPATPALQTGGEHAPWDSLSTCGLSLHKAWSQTPAAPVGTAQRAYCKEGSTLDAQPLGKWPLGP